MEKIKEKEKLIKIINKLIKFKTTSKNIKEIEGCLFWIENYCKSFSIAKKFIYNNFHSILLMPNNINKSDIEILLVGHIDVVDGDKSQFKAFTKNGKMFGRGAFDMKGPLAALILAFEEICSNESNMKVGLLITSDEEIGGVNGAGKIAGDKLLKPKIVIVPDGGHSFEIVNQGKGVAIMTIEVKGKSGHSSRPWESDNVIIKLSKIINYLRKYSDFKKYTTKTTITPTFLDVENYENNVIPQNAILQYNIRFCDDFDFKSIKLKIENEFGSKVFIKILSYPYSTNLSDNLSKKFIKILVKISKSKIIKRSYPSTCDARFFSNRGIPVIVTRPKGGGSHGPKEWIDINSLDKFKELVKLFIFENN